MRKARPVRFEFDSEAGALYIKINDVRVERTMELDEGIYADLDAEDRPLAGVHRARRLRRVDEAPRHSKRPGTGERPGVFPEPGVGTWRARTQHSKSLVTYILYCIINIGELEQGVLPDSLLF